MSHQAHAAPVGARILVVEDSADSAESLAKLLGFFGHEVQVARDGRQAITSALHWRPDFILLDLGLPGMDGYQVALRLKQEASCEKTVIIAVTGYGLPEDRRQSRAAGIDHHLLKPVELDLLLPLLSQSGAVPDGGGGAPGDPDSSAADGAPVVSLRQDGGSNETAGRPLARDFPGDRCKT